MSATSSSSISSSRRVFRYCATVSRRTIPFFAAERVARHFERLVDPLDHPLAFGCRRLRSALGRHRAIGDPLPRGFPGVDMPLLHFAVEQVDADARHARIAFVAAEAIVFQEWAGNLLERRFDGFRGVAGSLRAQVSGGERNSDGGHEKKRPTGP